MTTLACSQTRVQKGHDLSGDEWQRLLSARSFYRDATLLVCDEPSSALDARAEHAIVQQLRLIPPVPSC
jgi:ABC-type multidrug transport system fused ATPase/permease subunit